MPLTVPSVDVQPSDEEKNIIGEYFGKLLGLLGTLPNQEWFWPVASAAFVAMLALGAWGVMKKHPIALVVTIVILTLIAVAVFGG